MAPTLVEGDRLLVVPALPLRAGDVVVVPDPRLPARLLVKRVVSVSPSGVELAGDNAESSTDSRAFGRVARVEVLGRVVYRYAPPERAGRILRTRGGTSHGGTPPGAPPTPPR